jgi:hypothetical protein
VLKIAWPGGYGNQEILSTVMRSLGKFRVSIHALRTSYGKRTRPSSSQLHQDFMRFLSGSILDWQKNQLFKYW